jgi:predicted MPP superfamily phosphohydrolase
MQFKPLKIEPKDFSSRAYYPGTVGNPFHKIDKLQNAIHFVPPPIYAIIFGGIALLIFQNLRKPLSISIFILLDWIILSALSILKISFGPTHLTNLVLGVLRFPFIFLNFPVFIIIESIGTILVIYSFMVEPQLIKLETYKIPIDQAMHMSEDIHLIHLSDLHMEFFTKREKRALRMINDLSADLILYTGDFINTSYQKDSRSYSDINNFFNKLNARYGIFAVSGSPSVDCKTSLQGILANANFELINDQWKVIEINQIKLGLIGLSCSHQPQKDFTRLNGLVHNPQSETDFNILLYHSPDISPLLKDSPIDLQLAGHTHGGQVQIPIFGPIYTSSLYGLKFSSGAYLVNGTSKLIISRGLGLEGKAAPRVRFLSPPEIGLITLESQKNIVK